MVEKAKLNYSHGISYVCISVVNFTFQFLNDNIDQNTNFAKLASAITLFNRELVSTVLRVYLLGMFSHQQVFQLYIWFKRVPKAHRGIQKYPTVSQSSNGN
jgi:hypothetical protein